MGYACPVCHTAQADARHLANHLAVTASLGRRDHELWLEEYAPEWTDCSPDELADIVTAYAKEIDTPKFESGHDHGRPHRLEADLTRQARQPGRGELTADTAAVLEEARELTRQMTESTEATSENGSDENENA